MVVSKRVVLHFPKRLVDRPIVCRLVKDYNLEINILQALFTPEEEGLHRPLARKHRRGAYHQSGTDRREGQAGIEGTGPG